MREGLLISKHGENTQVEIMQARNKVKRLQTARKECTGKKNVQIACNCLLAGIAFLKPGKALSVMQKGQGHWKLQAKN